jgi:hypothetical protein
MSTSIDLAFVRQFGNNVFHLSQQKGSRLRGAVRVERVNGDRAHFERLGAATAQKKTGRHTDTPLNNTPHSRRTVFMNDYEYADLLDPQDNVRILIDPINPYAQAAQWAFGRSIDDEILDAGSGDAYTGVAGSGTQALPNTQKIASVSASAGANLNVQAVRRAKRIMDGGEVDPSIKRYIAHNAFQLESMLSETEVTSHDFNSVRALVMGEINTFLGANWIMTERTNTQSGTLAFDTTSGVVGSGGGDADTYDKVLYWAQDGLLLAVGEDVVADIGPRRDKGMATQVYTRMSVGAVRMEEEKVVEILAKED